MAIMTNNKTFLEELDKLKKKGYTCNFIKKNDSLYCSDKDLNFRSHELTITEQYRYEDKKEPSRNTVLYAIESVEYGLKGFLIN